MSKSYTIKIKCEIPELRTGFMQVMLSSKAQLISYLGQSLGSQGISSDIKMVVSGDEVIITQKSGDKGTVLVAEGTQFGTAVYSELPVFSKYFEFKEGAVSMYVKTPDNIDAHVGRYLDLAEAVANVNSNEIVEATVNIQKRYETKPVEENVTEELGDTLKAV
jgi:hypothetical protein